MTDAQTNRAPEYPEVASVVRSAVNAYKLRTGVKSVAQIAKLIGVSEAALFAWLGGQRRPNKKNIELITSALATPSESAAFQSQLAKAASTRNRKRQRQTSSRSNPLPRSRIRVGVVPYGPFSGTSRSQNQVEFLSELISRFSMFGGFNKSEAIEVSPTELSFSDPEIDIAVSVLATVDRARTMKFLITPIRIGLNGVAIRTEDWKERHKKIQRALRLENQTIPRTDAIFPIVATKEVGDLYIRNSLKMGEHGTSTNLREIEYLPARAIANILKNAHQDYERDRLPAAPVVVMDEFSCLQICEALGEEGALIFSPSGTDFYDSTNIPKGRATGSFLWPTYSLGFAVDRSRPEWCSFLEESFSFYLLADIDWLSSAYHELYRKLEKKARIVLQQQKVLHFDQDSSARWSRHCLSLGSQLIASPRLLDPAWVEVIRRAKQLNRAI